LIGNRVIKESNGLNEPFESTRPNLNLSTGWSKFSSPWA